MILNLLKLYTILFSFFNLISTTNPEEQSLQKPSNEGDGSNPSIIPLNPEQSPKIGEIIVIIFLFTSTGVVVYYIIVINRSEAELLFEQENIHENLEKSAIFKGDEQGAMEAAGDILKDSI